MAYSKLLGGVAVAAMLVAGGAVAQAADMPVPEDAGYDWSGIYIGGHAGGIASNIDGVFDEDDSDSSEIDVAALSTIGGMGGGQVGWNFQSGSMVFGVEADISLVDLDESRIEAQELTDLSGGGETTDVSFESDFLATVRGRIGWASDNVLLYATGGVAFLEGEVSTTADTSDDSCPDDPGRKKCSEDFSEIGGIVGAGLEWGASENVSIKVEGLYAFFDDSISLDHLVDGDDSDFFEVEDLLIARIGINFRLGNWIGG